MSRTANRAVLTAIESDSEALLTAGHWETRCLHCRSRVAVGLDGTLRGSATLEHIVPRSWFRQAAARDLCARYGGADDPRNLAIACARCNHDKGKGPDADGPRDARAREIIATLVAKRELRWRAPS